MTQPLSAPSPNQPRDPFAGAGMGHDDGVFAGRNVAEIGPIVQSWNESADLMLTDTDRIAALSGLMQLRAALDALTAIHLNHLDTGDTIYQQIGVSTRTYLVDHERLTGPQASALLKQGRNLAQFAGVQEAALAGDLTLAQAEAIGSGLAMLPAEVPAAKVDDSEAFLVQQAGHFTSRDLERLSAKVLEVTAADLADELLGQQLERNLERAQRNRYLSFKDDGHGTTRISGSLPTLEARAIESVLGAFAADEHGRSIDNLDAHTALSGRPQRLADALVTVCQRIEHCGEAPRHGGDRPRLVVTIEHRHLLDWNDSEHAHEVGIDHRLTPEELRQLACDADLLPIVLGGDGEILDVGQEERLVTPAIRAALTVRDRGCIFPGCDRLPVDCEAHHRQPWQAGGPTSLENLVLLCRHHHRVVEPAKNPADRARQWQTELHPVTGIPQVIPPPPTSTRDEHPGCTTGSRSDGEEPVGPDAPRTLQLCRASTRIPLLDKELSELGQET